MPRLKMDGNGTTRSFVATYKRGDKKGPRVFEISELDGFYVDDELNRTVHVTFDEDDVFVIDVYDSTQASYTDAGKALGIIEVNIRTGKAKFFTEGR